MLLSVLLLLFLNTFKFHLYSPAILFAFLYLSNPNKAKLHFCTTIQCDMIGFLYTDLKFLRKLGRTGISYLIPLGANMDTSLYSIPQLPFDMFLIFMP